MVLSKGNSKGFIALIPIGGHWAPNSTVGDNELWKYAQNIAKKNNPSETINKATPKLRPLCTAKVWLPKYVPSDITSLNQNDIDDTKIINARYKKYDARLKPCMVNTPVVVKVNSAILVYSGQGEGETRWKGCAWKLLLIMFFIFISILFKFRIACNQFITFLVMYFLIYS